MGRVPRPQKAALKKIRPEAPCVKLGLSKRGGQVPWKYEIARKGNM